MSTKEQYWKFSLIAIIIGLGIILFKQITPFLGGLLGALTIYILVRKQMMHLTEIRKIKRSISALLITAEAILCFLVPISLTVWLVVSKLQNFNLDPQSILHPLKRWQVLSRPKQVMMYWAVILCHLLFRFFPASGKL